MIGLLCGTFAASCTPSNRIVPLRGEDPAALELSGPRKGLLRETGATRALEVLRTGVLKQEWSVVAGRLGPTTLMLLREQAKADGVDVPGLLASGRARGLGFPGVENPLTVLAAPGQPKVLERDVYDPGRRTANVEVTPEGAAGPVVFPAVFTEDGWRVELVRLVEVPQTR
jgi:hypothetical protein